MTNIKNTTQIPIPIDVQIGEPVIIKENGKEDTIKNKLGRFTIKFDLTIDDLPNDLMETYLSHEGDGKKDGWYYTLTDGTELHEEELIVGTKEVRDYKINQINGVQ